MAHPLLVMAVVYVGMEFIDKIFSDDPEPEKPKKSKKKGVETGAKKLDTKEKCVKKETGEKILDISEKAEDNPGKSIISGGQEKPAEPEPSKGAEEIADEPQKDQINEEDQENEINA